MVSPETLHERQIVIITPEPEPAPGLKGPSYESTVKRPAGEVASDPNFTLYLGTNTGPYQTADNGTLILPPIPIEWIVAPRNVTVAQCPSRSDNLELFGITNAIAATLVLLTGCRPLVRFLTRGWLGNPSKYSALWTWTIAFAFQISSNAVISHLIVRTPGYEHLSMLNVFALYSSRPRLNQTWAALLRLLVGPIYLRGRLAFLAQSEKKDKRVDASQNEKGVTSLKEKISAVFRKNKATTALGKNKKGTALEQGRSGYGYDEYLRWRTAQAKFYPELATRTLRRDDGPEYVYTDSYVATSISEFFLQLVSAIFIGITWRRFPNEAIREHMKSNVNCMLAAPALSLFSWVLVPIWLKRDVRWLRDDDHPRVAALGRAILVLFVTGIFTYGVAWRYWSDFLKLPGSL